MGWDNQMQSIKLSPVSSAAVAAFCVQAEGAGGCSSGRRSPAADGAAIPPALPPGSLPSATGAAEAC